MAANYPYETPDAITPLQGQLFDKDPYLQYQPAFIYTLPIQLLVAGITLTLLCVLLIHLLFTAQYHYPLAPLNYILQLSSILVVLISVIIKIIVVLRNSSDNADQWPYDLDYVAVPIPPEWWTIGQDAAWFLLQALNLGLSNITHIQFLTLLYPSRTEARLIIFVLGPLAIASSCLVFTALSPDQFVLDLGDAIRNVLNSTLLLIFTISLFIWGFFVNRRRAWRFDGGTAIFGFGSLFLAVVSTTFNFVAVKEDGIDWLQHLLFAAILWQTWLGWWWWVGSGMGIGEVEDIMAKAERKKRKSAKRASRARALAARARANAENQGGPDGGRPTPRRTRSTSLATLADNSAAAFSGLSTSVAGILRNGTSSLVRRRTSQSIGSGLNHRDIEEGIELNDMQDNRRANSDTAVVDRNRPGDEDQESTRRKRPYSSLSQRQNSRNPLLHPTTNDNTGGGSTSDHNLPREEESETRANRTVEFSAASSDGGGTRGTGVLAQSTNSETSSTSQTPSLHYPRSIAQFISFPTTWVQVYLRRLRHAHEDAAKAQALERAELRAKVFAGEQGTVGGAGSGLTTPTGRENSSRRPSASGTAGPVPRAAATITNGTGNGKGKAKENAARMEHGVVEGDEIGWGLGSFGIREHREGTKRLQRAGELLSEGRLLQPGVEGEGEGESSRMGVIGEDGPGEVAAEETFARETGLPEDSTNMPEAGPSSRPMQTPRVTDNTQAGGKRPGKSAKHRRKSEEEDWEDVTSSSSTDSTRRGGGRRNVFGVDGGRRQGWSWWGPLKDWRLNDRSTF